MARTCPGVPVALFVSLSSPVIVNLEIVVLASVESPVVVSVVIFALLITELVVVELSTKRLDVNRLVEVLRLKKADNENKLLEVPLVVVAFTAKRLLK